MNKEKNSTGLIKTLVIALLSLGIGAGGFWFYTNSIAKQAPSMIDTRDPNVMRLPLIVQEPIFLDVDPFTVTLRNDMEARVLYTNMTLRLMDEDSKKRLVRYLPVMRSRILIELNKMNPSRLNDPTELVNAGNRIKQSLAAPISPELARQDIVDVLFTSFMVQ